MTCLVVEDDEIDRLTLLAFLESYSFLEVTGSYSSSAQALQAARLTPPDVLFLDIDMPGSNGLQLRQQLMHIPSCIFITAYPDYALEAFDKKALDFLVKPFDQPRFAKMMARLHEHGELLQKASLLSHTLGAGTVFIKDGHTNIKLRLEDILYLEAMNNYTSLVTANRKYSVLLPISAMIREKGYSNFIRIHRSYAVQKHFITRISSGEVSIGDITLPVGRIYKPALLKINR